MSCFKCGASSTSFRNRQKPSLPGFALPRLHAWSGERLAMSAVAIPVKKWDVLSSLRVTEESWPSFIKWNMILLSYHSTTNLSPSSSPIRGKRANKWACSTHQTSLCCEKMVGDGSSARWKISFLNLLNKCPIATCAMAMEPGHVLQVRHMQKSLV